MSSWGAISFSCIILIWEMVQYYITVPFNIEKTGDVNYAKRI